MIKTRPEKTDIENNCCVVLLESPRSSHKNVAHNKKSWFNIIFDMVLNCYILLSAGHSLSTLITDLTDNNNYREIVTT